MLLDRRSFASGEPNETWADFATVRAAIEPLKGRELQAAQAMQAEVEVKISTWYLSGVEPTMRVVHNSKYYSIVSVINPRLMNRELELMCTEGINIG